MSLDVYVLPTIFQKYYSIVHVYKQAVNMSVYSILIIVIILK